jgi:hypothetical protein
MSIPGVLAMAYLAASGLWTADDPFVGKWKLDAAHSLIVDQVEVESAGPNKFTFRFEGNPAETVVADGTPQPGVQGTTLAVTLEGPRSLKIVRKQEGRTLLVANWKLSNDGQTLRDDFANVNPDGSSFTIHYLYRRKAGHAGFTGLWESTTPPVGVQFELQIQPYGAEGLSFGLAGSVKNVTFDGQDHAAAGAAQGATMSGRRPSERALEITTKINGKISDTRTYKLSRDGRTLTYTTHPPGQTTPNVYVFVRE